MTRGRSRWFAAAGIGAGAIVLLVLCDLAGLVERLESIAVDARYLSGLGRKPPRDDIVIAWIDQESIDHLDRDDVPFPWPRSVYEQVLLHLRAAGARAVVFDLLFDQRGGNAEDDRAFAAALAQGRGDVLAVKFMDSRAGARTAVETAAFGRRATQLQGTPPLRAREHGVALPIAELATGTDQLGFVNIRPDADKTYRHYDALRLWGPPGAEAQVYPSLALAAALAAAGADGLTRTADGALLVPGAARAAAADAGARLLLNFRGPEFTYPHVKFVNILESINRIADGKEPLYPAARFRDRIVFVGINAEGYEDAHPTPLSARFPGVELHATALDNLLQGDSLRAPRWDLPCGALAAALATAAVFALPSVGASVLALGLLLAGFAAATLLCWLQLLVAPVAAPLLGGATAAAAAFVWRLVVEGRGRRELKRAFASYLAPEVLQQVLRDPAGLQLGGRAEAVTLLFTDLQGFSALAEQSRPEEVVAFLNDYFTRMCEPLLAEHGVIDKFIGDAIMVLFGAPVPTPDHGLRAVRAALGAQAISMQIAAGLRAAGRPAIATRIGIHSGEAVVGNMGSRQRFDYTAVGDMVNLASRLEGANKQFGTACLCSEATWTQAAGEVAGREVGAVAVLGRTAAVRVFEPLAPLAQATAGQRELAQRTAAALAALRAGDRAGAARAFADLAARFPGDVVARRYLERLAEPAWDGVFRLDGK